MAKQLNIDLSVRADTAQAKQAMLNLQKSLNEVISTRTITINDTSINNAKQAAIDLKRHLEAATNVNTGKLDLSKFSASLNKSGQSLQGLYDQLAQIGPTGQSAFLALSQSIAKADTSAISLGGKLGSLATTLKNTAKWQISSSILHGFMGSLQSAYGYAQDLNESLNNIRIVTGQSIDQMAKFAKEANSAAKALSTTTTEYTDASLIYYQQGLTDEEVKERTETTIKLANVSRQSAEEVSSQMTAIWNNFAKAGDNLEYYADVITALGAATASSSDEIAEGLSKFASVADTVGLSYEKATAALATVVADTRQSADVVGTAFKTIFARIEGLSLGETLEDGVDLNKYSQALETVGVNILDSNKQLKTMDTILDELYDKWNSIGEGQKIALAETVAGTRQYTQFLALMNNYGEVQKNQNIAGGAGGTLQSQADIYAESWEAARDRVTAAAEEIYGQLLNDEAFIDILNGFEKFLELISNVIDGLGGLKGILLLISSIFMQQYAKEMPTVLEKMVMNVRILTGEEEKRRQVMLKENAEIINTQMGKTSSAEVDLQIAGMKKISAMYEDLASKRQTLSQAEIESYENQIKEAEMRTQIAQAIGKEIDQINKQTNALEIQLKGQMGYNVRSHDVFSTIGSKNFENDKEAVNEGVQAAGLMQNNSDAEELQILQEKQAVYQRIQNLINLGNVDTQKLTEEEKVAYEVLQSGDEKLKNINDKVKDLQDKLNKNTTGAKLFEAFKTGATDIGKVQTVINHVTNKTDIWAKKMKEATNNPEKITALKKEMTAYADKLDEAGMNTTELRRDIEQLGNGKIDIETVVNSFKDLGENGIELSADRLEKLKLALENLGMDSNKLNELQGKLQQGGQAAEEAKAELEGMANSLNQLPNHTARLSEVFTQLGSSIMQVSMAINAIKNIGDIWSNEDLNTGEKVLQTMTAMGTLIPTLIGLYKSFKTIKDADVITTIKDMIAKTGDTVATEGAAAAQWSLNIAMEANPIGAIIAIILLLIAALTALTGGIFSFINAETEEEKAVREANEELERSKEIAESTKKAYEDLKSAVEDYDSLVDTLAQCTKGTQEWRDAFQEVLGKTHEILETYPDLLKYKNLFNDDGTLNTEVLNQAVQDAQDIANAAAVNTIEAQNKKILADRKSEIASLEKGVKASGIGSDNSEKLTATLLANPDEFNAGEEEFKDFLRKELINGYEGVNTENLETVVDEVSNSVFPLKDDFNLLSQGTEEVATSLSNSAKLIAQTFFGDEIVDHPEKTAAYNKALNEEIKRIETEDYADAQQYVKDHRGGWFWGALDDNKDKMEEDEGGRLVVSMMESYAAASGDDLSLKEKDMIKWDGDTRYLMFTDAQGNDVKVEYDKVAHQYATQQAETRKDQIMASGEEIYNQQLKTYDTATLDFLNNLNFNTTSFKDLQALKDSGQTIYGALGVEEGDEDALKEALESYYGELDPTQIEAIISDYNNLDDILAAQENIPEYIAKYVNDGIVGGLNSSNLEKVEDMYTAALASMGKEGAAILNSIAEQAGDEAGKVMGALATMDLSTMDAEQVNKALADLGINFQMTESQIYSVKNTLTSAMDVTAKTAQETYKSISSILSKLKNEGDTIEEKDYEELIKLNPAISSYFTMMADGTYMLTGAAEDFKTAVQTAQINKIQQAIDTQSKISAAYGTLSDQSSASQEELTQAKIYALYDDERYKDVAQKYQARFNEAIEEGKSLADLNAEVEKSYHDLNLSEELFAQRASEAADEVVKLTEAMKESRYQNEISNAGLEYETTENYANVLMELYEAEGLTKDAARELSIANQRLDRGLTTLNDDFKDWKESLKTTSKSSAEYAKTIGEIRTAFSDLLNIADADELSLNWIESWINDSEKMQLILDGNADAIQEFRESAFTEMTTNVFSDMKDSLKDLKAQIEDTNKDIPDWLSDIENQLNSGMFAADNLRSAIEDLGNTEIGSGATLSQEYVDSLNEMLAQGLLTEQQLNDIFATIGYKPKVTTQVVAQSSFIPEYTTYKKIEPKKDAQEVEGYQVESTTFTVQTGGKYMTQKIPVAQIESADNATGNIEIVNAGSQNIIPSYSATSGGSDSSSNKTTSAASHSHEVNRYSNEENAIKGLSDQYARLNDAKDRAFGIGRIQAIEQEIKKLKQLKEASSDYLDAIVGAGNASKVANAVYTGQNIGQMIASGQLGGTIAADYNSLLSGVSASGKQVEYTAKDRDGNQWLTSTNYSLADFNSMFGTNIHFDLDSYGNIQNKDALLNLIQTLSNNENSAYAAIADPSAASTTEYNKRIAYLEEIKERIEQYGETAELIGEKTDEYLDYISQLQEKNAELITTKMDTGVELGTKTIQRLERSLKILGDNIYKTVEAMQSWFDATFKEGVESNKQQANAYATAFKEVEEQWGLFAKENGEFDENAIDSEHAAEILQSIEDGYDSLIDDLLSRMEQGKEYYGNVLDYWKEKISDVTDQIEINANTLSHYQKVLELAGRSTDYKALGKILQGQLDTARDTYSVRKDLSDRAEERYQLALAEKDRLKARGASADAIAAYEENVLKAARIDRDEQLQEMQSALENVLEKVNAWYENKVNEIFQESERRLTGAWGSFDALDAAMERQQAVADEYLTKTNQIYETNTLLRKLSQDIDKNDSRMAKEKLKAFADEIAAMKQQEKLSKTDLEIAKARYEVLKAQIALEEAQNAKSTVRLQRDSEGNYGYVYTADQDAISDAEQNLADKQNDLYNLVLGQAQDYAQKLIQIREDYQAALQDLYQKAADGLITEEEFNKQKLDLYDKYRQLELAAQDSHNTAIVWLNQIAAEGQTEAWTDSFEDIIKEQDSFEEYSKGIVESLDEQLGWLKDEQGYYIDEAKLNNDELENSVDEVTDTVHDLKVALTGKDGIADAMSTAMNKAQNLTSEFFNQYDALSNLVSEYQVAADQANNLYFQVMNLTRAQQEYNSAVAASASYGSGFSGSYGDNSNGNYSGNTGTFGNTTANSSSKKNTKEYQTDDQYFRISYPDGAHWSYEPGSRIYKENGQYYYDWNGKKLKATTLKSGGYTGKWASAKTGMYTGSWNGPDLEENGKLAFLHQKELVLNADDTENMLNAVKLIRQISQTIDLQAAIQGSSFIARAAQFTGNDQILQQEVTIHAEFPNATNHSEIEEAFNNLVNRASQFANRE